MFASEVVAGATHLGRQLVDLLYPFHDVADHRRIAQVADDEFVRRKLGELVTLQVDGSDPMAFASEPLNEVAADEATGAVDKDAFHGALQYTARPRGAFVVPE